MPLSQPRLLAATRFAFRALFSLIFVVAGAGHLLKPGAMANRLSAAPGAHLVSALGSPSLLVVLSGAVLLLGGLALLTGFLTRWAALALAAVLLPITLTVQVGSAEGMGPLFKNIALLGGLLHWGVEGAGAWSLDAWLSSRVRQVPALLLGAASVLALTLTNPALAARPAGPGPASTGAVRSSERVLLLVQQPPQLKAALATGQQALAGKGFPAREVEVLVCGPAITSLVAGDAMEPRLQEAAKAGVRVVACGLTLQEKGIGAERLSSAVQVVENGLVEALQRQAEGFRSVEL